jgi:hypothetical protein
MRIRFVFLGSVVPLALAAQGCGSSSPSCNTEIACQTYQLAVDAPAGTLVSMSGCGVTTSCSGTSPCTSLLFPPPAQGGACSIVVTFASGATTTIDFDWGAPSQDACCGTVFANAPQRQTFGGTWAPAAPMAAARYGHAAVRLDDGRVLVVGGMDATTANLASAEIYDPTTNVWTGAPDMGAARALPSAVPIGGGRILVVGGTSADAEIFDGAAWTAAAPMTHARYYQRAVALASGKVLVAGGGAPEAELYDPATDSWSSAGTMATTRESFALFATQTGAIAIGGDDTATVPATKLASTEIYDATSNAWHAGPSMTDDRYDFSAGKMADGRIFVAGGYGSSGATISRAEMLLADGSQWESVAGTLSPREEAPAVVTAGGGLLVAGGGDTGNAEIWYDGSSWVDAGAFDVPVRVLATLTELVDGRVLLVGGAQDDGAVSGVTDTAELYTP